MFRVELLQYDELTEEEQQYQSDDGNGKEYANYVKISKGGKTIEILSDAIEPEDRTYSRDFGDAVSAIRDAYELGVLDGQAKGK